MKAYNVIALFSAFTIFSQNALATLPSWSYDPGPNPKTKMGKELIDLTASIPNMPDVSLKVMGDQKFRPAFGPVPWRMLQEKNKVKILFIGQDATHIAEAAGRPATAGFGGRAQDLAAYFGVNEGAAFINTYAYTIKGQYGAYETPYIFRNNKTGKDEVRFSNLVSNQLWLISQDKDSPITKWRNDLIDWIISNNQDSIKLIVTFGGAARDAMGAYMESKGAKVGSRLEDSMNMIQVAETKLEYAGGNNEFPVLVDRKGYDLYPEVIGKKLDYSKVDHQQLVKKELKENSDFIKTKMVFTKAGPMKNGLIHHAQLGGYDLNKIKLQNKITRSLKGVKLKDGSTVRNEVLVVELPHPTFLSNLSNAEASKAVAKDLEVLAPYVQAGWRIPADPDKKNSFASGQPYRYSRADIGPEYYDFGTPGTRMVPVSTASRMGGNPHVIVFGTREIAKFDRSRISQMTDATPAESFSSEELFVTRPRSNKLRYTFDAGPGEYYARLMKENLDMKTIFKAKPGKSFSSSGIDAFYVKNHPDIGDYGHYRGTFSGAKIILMADPEGHDDLITARALTGTRGQFLQGLMRDLKVDDKYLVLKTVPFSMDGAATDDWSYVLKATEKYRSELLQAALKDNPSAIVVTDGPYAASEVSRILGKSKTTIVNLDRSKDLKEESKKLVALAQFKSARITGTMSNIPRSHLSFYARIWEGTSGDRVLASQDKHRGLAFAEVAPAWAWKQRASSSFVDDAGVGALIDKLERNDLPLPGEKIPTYLKRVNIDPSLSFIQTLMDLFKQAA
jgi:hypothetical protein